MSYGQELMRRYIKLMSSAQFEENYRPEWLFGMELDFYFPAKNCAIEFNGDQHIVPTAFGNPKDQMWRDIRKRQICKERGIYVKVLDASDLEYTRLIGRFKRVFGNKRIITLNKEKLRELNKESSRYRKLLIEKWDSPTAHKHKTKIRKESIERVKKSYGKRTSIGHKD